MLRYKQLATALFTGLLSVNLFAADQTAREDVTPPPAEGALTVDQIPPITSTLPTSPRLMQPAPAPQQQGQANATTHS